MATVALVSFAGAAIAETASLLFYYPYDLIKTRMQTSNDRYKYRNLVDAFCKIYENEKSFLKGAAIRK